MLIDAPADVLDRVRELTRQLRALRIEMGQPATDASTGLAKKKVPLDAARELKNAVDEFRLFLWAYLDVWDATGDDAKIRLQRIRMQGAADMLALIADELKSTGRTATTETTKLRQQIDNISPLL